LKIWPTSAWCILGQAVWPDSDNGRYGISARQRIGLTLA
jgi:hypothetical protein